MEKFSRKFPVWFLILVGVIVGIDFSTKWVAEKELPGKIVPVLGEYFRLVLVYNTGGIFGIMQGNPKLFQVLTGVALVFLLWYYWKEESSSRAYPVSMAFIFGGAIGNFLDRFYRIGVVDFIDIGVGEYRWPAFNLADTSISIGAFLLFWSFFTEKKKEAHIGGE